MIHVITVPHWCPTPLNKLMRNRWVAYKLKKLDRETLWHAVLIDRIPAAQGKRKVDTHILLKPKRGRKIDPDSVLKSLLDALVQTRMLIDDSDKHCDWTKPTFEAGTLQVHGTRITLTDIE